MTKQNFYENQIFEQEYPPEAAEFCNNSQLTENRFHIAEIEPTEGGVRRFQIRRNPEPTAAETSERRIRVLEAYLSETDWYCARYVDSGVPIPEEVQSKRQEAREEISALRGLEIDRDLNGARNIFLKNISLALAASPFLSESLNCISKQLVKSC